ncbi:peptidase M20 [Aeromicrobium sp. Root495]|uniref:ArgE/DapE family deacylase n=1 Tax=Aeromicrobium sp. Root495 TaxID=1736550 RepID=UPI00070186A3|nr:ArgE/DapE family deacylase [Aeromicrobium sp. Root495]KQY56032.1 peptidase M20 [Aeromicrobium sp. Root495]
MDIDVDLIRRDLAQLVSYASTGGSEAEVGAQRWCAATMQGLGLEVDLWSLDLDALRADPDYPGEEVERHEAWGCVGTGGGEGTPELVLNGHVDVVPSGDPDWWTGHDPWGLHESDGRWYGRGVCDMKGGVVAILAAVRAVGDQLTRPFAVHTVIGEEDGGLGTFATLRRGHTGTACLIAEPTAGTVVSANAGALTFRLEVRGRSTHGSRAGEGVSALDLFEHVHAALRRLDAERARLTVPPFGERPWPISVGIVSAGDWASTVPDQLVAEGRFGIMPGESFAEATAVFEQAVASVDDPWLRDHPVQVTWPGGRFAAGSLPDGHAFGADVTRAVEATGADSPPFVGAPYGSDLRQYAAHGVPTVQYGPGHIEDAHAVDEQVAIDEVVRCAEAYAHLLLQRCR